MWGHVEHVEQLGWGLCQHCLHQMPRGGGGWEHRRPASFYDETDGGWESRVPVRETDRELKAVGECEKGQSCS